MLGTHIKEEIRAEGEPDNDLTYANEVHCYRWLDQR